MTAIVRTAESLPGQPDLLRRRVTGTPAEVSTTVAMVRDRGYLVAATAPREVPGDPHRVTVLVTLRTVPAMPTMPAPARQSIARQLAKPLGIVLAVAGTLAGLGYGGYLLLRQTVQAAAAGGPVALGVLVVLGLVLLALGKGRRGGCSGLHCGGSGGH